MADVAECPSCGESEELRGESQDGDIKITCLSCEAQWMRGEPRCAGCGGQDIAHRPQAMTRLSRGTQLSIIGWRELPLCRACDAEALQTSLDQNVPVPGEYVAVCLFGAADGPTAPAAPKACARPEGARRTQPTRRAAAEPRHSTGPEGSAGPEGPAGPPRPSAPRQSPSPRQPKPASITVPTVRQAIAAFLNEASGDADSTAMLLLGTHLGSYNRLDALDAPDAADGLATWCAGHWPDRDSDAAQRALGTICRAVDFWGARGWLTSDPAAGLR